MKRFTLTILAALIAAATIAHAITWQKTFDGGNGYCVQETSDDNFIISGETQVSGLWLIKTDTLGSILWDKKNGGSGWIGKWVEQTSDGGYIVASRYPTLLKADENGDTIWTKDFGMYSYCVQETSDSGYIVVCGDNGNEGDTSLKLVKTDSEGNIIWNRTHIETTGKEFNLNAGFFIQQTSDSGFIVTGETGYGEGQGDFATTYLWLLKTDAEGNLQWSKKYGTGGNFEFNSGRCVRQTSDCYYIISGEKGFAPGGFWLLKTDENGDTLWTQTYGGEYGGCVIETWDGNYAAVGRGPAASIWESSLPNGGDVLLIKVDPDGNTIWERYHGGDDIDIGRCVDQTSDGGYIVCGGSGSFDPVGLYLLKTDSLGFVEAIEEEPIPVTHQNWEVTSPLGHQVVLRYRNQPTGLRAYVFDVCGREVNQIRTNSSAGTLVWGQGYPAGVYFIQVIEKTNARTEKVVLVH